MSKTQREAFVVGYRCAVVDVDDDHQVDENAEALRRYPDSLQAACTCKGPIGESPPDPDCPWCSRDGRSPRKLELQWVCEHCGYRGDPDAEPTLVEKKAERDYEEHTLLALPGAPQAEGDRDILGHTKTCQYLDWHGQCTCGGPVVEQGVEDAKI
jgi:hypothetical protein